MELKNILTDSTLGRYVTALKNALRELVFNRHLLLTAGLYALCGISITWDQGSSSVIPSLPGFQQKFGITSATNPSQISNFVSLVYVGAGLGGGLSFFFIDRIGRLWSLRLYMTIYIVGQLIATLSDGYIEALYTARIISELGIGALTVIGPVSISEVAPTEFRGFLTVWFSIVMLLALTVSCLVVLASYLHIAAGPMQYQVVFFIPIIVLSVVILGSFFLYDSPRWLFLVGRDTEATDTLIKLRGLPVDHLRVMGEIEEITSSVRDQKFNSTDFIACCKETFLVPSNLRRLQQGVLSYALAQLSGANSVTSYLVPIFSMIWLGGGAERSLFLSSMYSLAKFFFTIMASFFFVDALGRRKSLFIGITIQMLSDVYLGVFIKYRQEGPVTHSASEAAVVAIFIHGLGYAVGLLVLPYVFVAEVWPNQIPSFGSSFCQLFHWLFYFGINRAMPSLLEDTHDWGAFIFFAGWCFVSLTYVFFIVPETSGLGLKRLNAVFEQPLWKAYLSTRNSGFTAINSRESA